MFTELILDSCFQVAPVFPCWNKKRKKTKKKTLPRGCTWLAEVPAILWHRVTAPLLSRVQICAAAGEKRTTHHRATAWCVAWLMHELMWVFPLNSSLFISLEQRGSGFIRIFNQRGVFVPSSSPVTFSTKRSRTHYGRGFETLSHVLAP